jgi:hypothetical protein
MGYCHARNDQNRAEVTSMAKHTLRIANNGLNTNIYSYLETCAEAGLLNKGLMLSSSFRCDQILSMIYIILVTLCCAT